MGVKREDDLVEFTYQFPRISTDGVAVLLEAGKVTTGLKRKDYGTQNQNSCDVAVVVFEPIQQAGK